MKKEVLSLLVLLCFAVPALSQTGQPTPEPQSPQVQRRATTSFDISEYGVDILADPRLIIMKAALEAAGFDPTPAGREPSVFRQRVRKDQADLDPELRQRLRTFYERNRLPAPATVADQSARYVSLALALGPPPSLAAPERSEDLPGGLLEVLDFAPLVQEFYRRSGIDERMVLYTRAYHAEGDRLRPSAAEMVRSVLSYLHTRPILTGAERVAVKSRDTKKPPGYTWRDHDRRFIVLPDLLAAPGAINFRIIGDQYYAIIPEGTDPTSSELRRAYLQYVIDPIVLRFNRDVAARRDDVKQLLDARTKSGATVTPDVFLSVSRSLVAAADASFEESRRLQAITSEMRERIANVKDDAARAEIARENKAAIASIQDETIARLAEEYERGAVLAFHFAEQLKGIEDSGFDVANFFVDMISSFTVDKELKRLAEHAEARQRAAAAREARLARRAEEVPVYTPAEALKAAALVKKLSEIEEILRLRDYPNAEVRLKDLFQEFPREPRVFFALAQTASLAAADATDEDVQSERLNRALANYRLAIEASSAETDRALLSRAREAMGRIHAFMDDTEEALKQFDEAIKIGDVRGGAYREALEGKKKLSQP